MSITSGLLLLKVLRIHPHFKLVVVAVFEICSVKSAVLLTVTPKSLTVLLTLIFAPEIEEYPVELLICSL